MTSQKTILHWVLASIAPDTTNNLPNELVYCAPLDSPLTTHLFPSLYSWLLEVNPKGQAESSSLSAGEFQVTTNHQTQSRDHRQRRMPARASQQPAMRGKPPRLSTSISSRAPKERRAVTWASWLVRSSSKESFWVFSRTAALLESLDLLRSSETVVGPAGLSFLPIIRGVVCKFSLKPIQQPRALVLTALYLLDLQRYLWNHQGLEGMQFDLSRAARPSFLTNQEEAIGADGGGFPSKMWVRTCCESMHNLYKNSNSLS